MPRIGTETSNLQVKFHSRIAFQNWYFPHYRCFMLRLLRLPNRKFWRNKIASSMARNFGTKCQLYLNFSERKNPLSIFLSNVKISVWSVLFFKKNVSEEVIFSKFWRYVISTKWLHEYPFWPGLRHLSVLSKKYSSATLVNIRQKLWQFKRKK